MAVFSARIFIFIIIYGKVFMKNIIFSGMVLLTASVYACEQNALPDAVANAHEVAALADRAVVATESNEAAAVVEVAATIEAAPAVEVVAAVEAAEAIVNTDVVA